MNHSNSGLAHGTSGSPQLTFENGETEAKVRENEKKITKQPPKEPIFSSNGHVTAKSISARREFFLGKSVAKLEDVLHSYGYETKRRPSVHSGSKAKMIITTNQSKERNIQQIQVSPGSKRHGNVPYVKISTSDYGKIKIIGASANEYITDGKEKSLILFRRKK